MSVFQQIPPASSIVVDPKTGQITGLWYNYLVNFGSNVAGFLLASNNLSDVANAATARSNLGALGATGATTITTLGTIVTGTWNATTIGVPYGGTGLTSCAQGDLVYGSASNTFSKLAKDTNSTRYLSNQGTSNNPSWNQVNLANGVTGTLGVGNAGTGLTTYTQGDILYASASNTLSALAKNASATRYLSNTGSSNNPAWAQIDLSNGTTGTLTVPSGGTGVTSATAYAVLCGGTTSTAAFQSVSGVGSSGQILTSNGAGALPTWQTGASTGKPIVQQVYTQTGTVATGTTAIPADNTIPQNTEGDQYMTLAITPTNASNLLVIHAGVIVSNSNATQALVAALFQDSTANALVAAEMSQNTATLRSRITLHYIMAAGTTSSTTFKIRAGGQTGATTTFNGTAGGQLYGGVYNSYIHIQEITV